MGLAAPAAQEPHGSIASSLPHPLQPSLGGAFVREAPADSSGRAGAAGEGPLVPPHFLAGSSSPGARTRSPPCLGLLQEVLPPELFDVLVLTLCRQAPALSRSLAYARLVMAVLTTYHSQVSGAGPGPWGLPRGSLAVQLSAPRSSPPRLPRPTGAAWPPRCTTAMRL